MSYLLTASGGAGGIVSANLGTGLYRELTVGLNLTTLSGGITPSVGVVLKLQGEDGTLYQLAAPTPLTTPSSIVYGFGAGVGASPTITFGDLVQASVVLTGTQYTLTLGAATAGTFTLSYQGQTTAGIAWNATPAIVQAALQLLSSLGTGATCSGGTLPGGTLNIQLSNALLANPALITGNGTGLTGGALVLTNPPTVAWTLSVSGK